MNLKPDTILIMLCALLICAVLFLVNMGSFSSECGKEKIFTASGFLLIGFVLGYGGNFFFGN